MNLKIKAATFEEITNILMENGYDIDICIFQILDEERTKGIISIHFVDDEVHMSK